MISESRRELLRRRLQSQQPASAEPTGRPSGPIPLSFAQQRLWFLDQLEPGSAEYNSPLALRLGGGLDVAILRTALAAIAERHEILRTRLVATDGVARQIIDLPSAFPLIEVDLTGLSDPLAQVERLVLAHTVAPFDLASGPMILSLIHI